LPHPGGTADELKDDEEYEDIMEDMRLEAGKYGIYISCLLLLPFGIITCLGFSRYIVFALHLDLYYV
jgi:hypothetical protein